MELREASAPASYKVLGNSAVRPIPEAGDEGRPRLTRMKCRTKVPGDVRFRVQLTCDQLQQPVLKEESSRFYKP